MKLDKIDMKILYHLDYNARIGITELAKKLTLSKQNINYRIKKLTENSIIEDFTVIVNTHLLGYVSNRAYLRLGSVSKEEEEKIKDYLIKNENILWFVTLVGSWDYEIVILSKNIIHFNNTLKKIKTDLNNCFTKIDISTTIVNYHFKRKYLIEENKETFKPKYYGFEPKEVVVDTLDVNILNELKKNCRQSNQEIGIKYNVTYHTIKNRIKILEEKGIISGYRIKLNLEKINKSHHKILFKLKSLSKEKEKEIYLFASRFNFVVYIVEIIGEYQLEIEFEVSNQNDVNKFLREFRNKFDTEIIDFELLQVTKEIKLDYFPIGNQLLQKLLNKKSF
jgi:DNA-binding Lrp family transcriptional regulator